MTTTYTDPASGFKAGALQARTDPAGSAVTDMDGEEMRLFLEPFTQGIISPSTAFQVVEDSPASMNVLVGSGSAETDISIVDGTASGQGPYVVRLQDGTVSVSVPASDASNPRLDELYLVVLDDQYDAGGLTLPRLAYRDGTPATSPSAPGPDSAWDSFLLLASISVGASVTSISNSDITDERVSTTSDVDVAAGRVATASIQDDAVTPAKASDTFFQSFEVDDYIEVSTSGTLGTSYADVASVTLSIPSSWNSWKCFVSASSRFELGGSVAATADLRLVVDGTALQAVEGISLTNDNAATKDEFPSVVGRRTGLTTTGSRTVSLQARESFGNDCVVLDMALHARAVRTS